MQKVFTVDDCLEDMLTNLRNGKVKGTTTHIPDFDNSWKWRKKETNIWTGYNNEGKSQFLIFLCLLKALLEGWKFAFFSPENFPPDEFFDDIIHTISGMTTDKDYKDCIDEQTYLMLSDLLRNRFYFVYLSPDDSTIENILDEFKKLHDEHGLDGVIIDPWLKVKRVDSNLREDIYGAEVGSILTSFARLNDLSVHLVMHQGTPVADETGNFPKPNLYRIKGGGAYSDGFDNVLYTWRKNRNTDPKDNSVEIGSDKIKKQKLVGVPGNPVTMRFNRRTNRYTDTGDKDFIDWGKFLPGKRAVYSDNTILNGWMRE